MGKEGAFILQLLAQLQGNNLSNEQVKQYRTHCSFHGQGDHLKIRL